MKKLFSFISGFALAAILGSTVSAQTTSATVEKLWSKTTTELGATVNDTRQGIGRDGVVYLLNKANQSLVAVSAEGQDTLCVGPLDVAEGVTASLDGTACTLDDAGNFVIEGTFPNIPSHLVLRKADGSIVKDYAIKGLARTDYITATGDVFSAEGGHVFLYGNNANLLIYKVAEGVLVGDPIEVVGVTNGNNNNVISGDDKTQIIHHRTSQAGWMQVENGSESLIEGMEGFKKTTMGGDIITLAGKEFYIYPTGTTNYNSEFCVRNMTDGVFVVDKADGSTTSFTPNSTEAVSSTIAACWLSASKIDDNNAYIHVFNSQGVAVYKLSVSTPVDTPSDSYVIKYTSSDGNIVTPYASDVFGANIVSNTYSNGQGVITFDGPVTSIGLDAFYNCSVLTSITIPNSVTRIGSSAFRGCSSLTSITIPNSVTSIGDYAFRGCSSLTSMVVEEGNTTYDSRDNCNAIIKTATNTLIAGCQNTTIPNNVTRIGSSAFYDCSSLTSITIPNSVTSIGSNAFYGTGIFKDKSNWHNYSNDALYIDDCLIEASSSISGAYTIKENTRLIADNAFYGGRSIFGYSSLTSITIPNSVTSIGEDAFYKCSSLTKTNYTGDVASWCNIKFGSYYSNPMYYSENFYINNVEIKDLVIPNSVDSIHNYAFLDCSSLTSITIPNSVTSIGDYAFRGCSSLTSVTIGNSVTSIGNYAFCNCSSLISVTIPNSVTSIGNYAFYKCSSLTSVTIGESVTSIGEEAFYRCSSLTSITIPNSVTTIGYSAFEDCSSLTSVTIGNSVTTIGYSAFSSCMFTKNNFVNNSTLDAVANNYWGARVGDTEINGLLIKDDTILVACRPHLTSVTIPNSVTSIGEEAFYRCSSLTSITIPNSVTSIGEDAFVHCSSLTSIYLPYNIPVANQLSFDGSHFEEVKLYVPFESYENYKNDSIWSLFKNILYIDNFYENNVRYRYIMDGEILSASLLTEENFKLFSTISIIGSQNWYYDSKYGATMNGYQNNVTHQNEDWLISPALDLSKHSSATLTFSHAFGPKASVPSTADQKAQYTCWVSNDFNGDVATATWTELPITYGTSAWSYITTTVDIPAENLKENCHIAWKYVCTTSSATWEIKSVEIGGSYTRPVVKVIAKNDKYSNDVVIPSVVTHNYADYSVEIIAASAFSSCPSLTSITIGNNVKSIENYAFESCSSLTSVMLGGKIETIGENAFSGCTALNEITLPTSVKSIGENAFAGCTKLYDIYCFAMEPPTAYESSFANYNAFLHVPCDNQRVYLLDVIFGNFKFIECIEAETTPTDTVVVTPSFNDAEFIWPSNSSADSYTLAISKDGEVFCTLTFNANGQLTGIAFAPSRNGQHNAPAAVQTANGFAFTVTGLDEGTEYCYELLIQDRSGNTLQSYSGEFRTQSTNDRTVTVEYDAAQGQVTGAGTYLVGDTVTLTAIPNDGYRFVRWSNEVVDNPYTFVISDNVTISAEFEKVIATSIEHTHSQSPMTDCQKIIHNGQLLILRDGKIYTVMGQEL